MNTETGSSRLYHQVSQEHQDWKDSESLPITSSAPPWPAGDTEGLQERTFLRAQFFWITLLNENKKDSLLTWKEKQNAHFSFTFQHLPYTNSCNPELSLQSDRSCTTNLNLKQKFFSSLKHEMGGGVNSKANTKARQ